MRNPKPRWGLLYAVVPLAAFLLVAAHLAAPSDGWQQLTEGIVSLGIIGAMGLWVRVNRLALMLDTDQDDMHQVGQTQGMQPLADEFDAASRREGTDSPTHVPAA